MNAAAGAAIAGVTVTATGLVEKINKPRAPYFTAIDHYRAQVNTPFCTFNIQNLPDQV